MVSVAFAFAAAFANALNLVTQHVASTGAPARDKGWRLAVYLVRNPLWLLGAVAMVGSFVFEAVALYEGLLSVVQAISVTELVFSLVIGTVWLRRRVRPAAWAWAALTCVGLAVFLVMSEPHGGHVQPTSGAWPPVIVAVGGTVALLTILASRGSPARRAALYASGSGIAWASTAMLLKSASDAVADHGPLGAFAHGAIYGVVVAGVGATVLTQAALHHGPLAISQPLMVAVDPFVSILLGIWLYGEHFTHQPVRVALGVAGFITIVVGVVFLSRTAPSLAHPSQSGTPDEPSGAGANLGVPASGGREDMASRGPSALATPAVNAPSRRSAEGRVP